VHTDVQIETERTRWWKRRHNKHVTNGRDNAMNTQHTERERRWQQTGKKVTKCWHRFSFHFILFPLCFHLCHFVWWRGHVLPWMDIHT